jgi:peptidoglycan/xylan/chitin deacetylase (PgdA/CDA1 family)
MNGACVLLYHRVAEVEQDPLLLCVTPKHFAEHLDVLRGTGGAMSLETLARRSHDKQLPRRGVAVTFDDGYADNLLAAKPLLEKSDIPATVFTTAGQIDSDREFWWDEIERLLLLPGTLPATEHHDLGDAAQYSQEDVNRFRGWNVLDTTTPTRRHAIYRDLIQRLSGLGHRQRDASVACLRQWASDTGSGRSTHRAMTAAETAELADSGCVEVGAHTVTHSKLSAIPLAEQRDEISGSKTRLEAVIGRPVRSFAYPFGTMSDYTVDTVALVRAAGFEYACSNVGRPVRAGADAFQLPRIVVRDWDGDEFAKRLRGWFAD